MKRWPMATWVVLAAWMLGGCASGVDSRILGSQESQVRLRAIQARVFETPDTVKTLKSVMATLQDLGFVLDKADGTLGTVSGTKLDAYAMRITVTVHARGEHQQVVRANAELNQTTVVDPLPYQRFFAALEKAMFLNAEQVD